MGYKVIQIAEANRYLDGRERDKPLPEGVEVQLRQQAVSNDGNRKVGDCFVEYTYANAAAKQAHLAQRQGL